MTGLLRTAVSSARWVRARTVPAVLWTAVVVLGFVVVQPSPAPTGAQADPDEPVPVREVRSIPTAEHGAARPAGLAAAEDGTLLVAHGNGGRTRLLEMTPAEDPLATTELPPVTNPATVAFDPARDRLTAISGSELLDVDARELRDPRPPVRRHGAGQLRLGDPQGATFDPATGTQFVLDARDRSIVRVPMSAGVPGVPTRIALPALSGARLRGIALNPRDGLLYVASPDAELLYGVDQSGAVQKTYSLDLLELSDLRSLLFAPSADPTDDPAALDLYLADAGGGLWNGRVVEATLAAAPAVSAPTVSGSLQQTLPVSQLNPPSPDPAGITYLPGADRLEVADSEVEEMPIFQGANLFQITRGGQLTDTGVTTAFSNEPTGAGFDPATGTLFLSDDNANRVFMIRPGADGRYGTADDQRSNLSTIAFGSDDAEGCEFDPTSGHLFVVDGLAREVYDVNPVDGTFGDGNDVVTHFDLEQHGVLDPEGIGVDTARNSLVVVDRAGRKIYEVDKSGALLQIVTFAAANPRNPAGLAVAPATKLSGRTDYWVVERGVDNNTDPNENDGRVYEIAVPSPDAPASVVRPIVASLDDVEERSNGRMWVATSDLDLVSDGTDVQTVGLRFTAIEVPQGATIAHAYVQFQTDEATSGPTSLTIRAQASDDAPAFTTARFDVSSRPRTTASAAWTPVPWSLVGERGLDQRTPDLSAVLQDVVSRPGWRSGSSLVLVITGSGSRVAESFDGTFAPVLHIELATG